MSTTPPRQNVNREPLVGVAEAAAYLGVSRSFLYERADRHGIPCLRVGNRRRYRISDLAEHLASQAVAA